MVKDYFLLLGLKKDIRYICAFRGDIIITKDKFDRRIALEVEVGTVSTLTLGTCMTAIGTK